MPPRNGLNPQESAAILRSCYFGYGFFRGDQALYREYIYLILTPDSLRGSRLSGREFFIDRKAFQF
ncbi:MAG: hypothetical protein RLZZ435_1120 [Cyanobacteriota bacterium]|jgi:hypothetical protein